MAILEAEDIQRLLPHRYPMLLVDRIVELEDGKRIVGIKSVAANEPYFQGHFPGMPVMPGVLQLEAMAQTGGILLKRISGAKGTPYFLAIDNARFRKVVKPGDQLRIEVTILNLRSRAAKFKATAWVGEDVASEAELMCMLAE